MQLLVELQQAGATLRVDGSTLYVKPNPVDATVRERIRAHKDALIELLTGGVAQYALDYKREMAHAIPAASPVEALAHDLIKLCTTYGLRLHATPDGILLEVTAGDWCAVMRAIEEAGYQHIV